MVLPDITEYHKSTSKELDAIKNRIRNLIGSANWGDEGRYKESILKSVIRRVIPKTYAVGTGYVVHKENRESQTHETSKQIDIIVYNVARPIYFSDGDFVIVTPEAVNGIIEVKTNLQKLRDKTLSDIFNTANENGKFISDRKIGDKTIFNGIFAYEGYNTFESLTNKIERALTESVIPYLNNNNVHSYLVNHISFDCDYFMKYWRGNVNYTLHKLNELSFSYFISNLISYLTNKYMEYEKNMWFPIDKEIYKIKTYSFKKINNIYNLKIVDHLHP